jgi:2-polyprenyl-3-methyl-5-hydroxy-6-metoxy-1,4-benzoquinol methylase
MGDGTRHGGTQDEITAHFDEVAQEYDYWKAKNWLYYDTLRLIARAHAKPGALLDVGCGTGEMIRAVAPISALGIDISPAMVEIAKKRNEGKSEYVFIADDITRYEAQETFTTILFFDVIEHVVDMQAALRALRKALEPDGALVITMANPLWEPILMLGEKLGMKMPEGPHYRIPARELISRADTAGLRLVSREWHLLFPKYIPLVSGFINAIGKFPFIRRLSVIEVFVFGAQ